MAKKIILSGLSGLIIMIITWKYQNYDYSLSLEDKFIKKLFTLKDNIYSTPSKAKADFVFINTGKDLVLVEDSLDYGVVAISDREKIYRFVTHLNNLAQKPLFSVIDIQFYYPYTADPLVDSLLGATLANNNQVLIPIIKRPGDDDYKIPLYKAPYAYSNYRTFGSTFNKFRVMNQDQVASIPRVVHERIDGAVYKDHFLFPTCNGRLCLSAIWPNYYLRNRDIGGLNYQTDVKDLKEATAPRAKGRVTAQYYNIGEILFDLDADREKYQEFFRDKIVFIGNFEEDVHTTPVGKMAGPVLLANIYLSLLNKQHIMSPWLILIVWLAFSGMSYVAWFKKIPELRFNFKFIFSSFVEKFIKGYISYFGVMFFLSLIVLGLFNVQVALFLPSLIFAGIEYVRQKKYKNKPVAMPPPVAATQV